MRSVKEIIKKRKKLRNRLLRALIKQSQQKKTENCKFWITDLPEPCKCVYPKINDVKGETRDCPNAKECPDFQAKWGTKDVHEKYLRLKDDDAYLARNFRDLFILNWVLGQEVEEKKPSFFKRVIGLMKTRLFTLL